MSIYDRAVGAYSRPGFVRSEGEAVRVFVDEVNRKAADNPMHAHPEHFTLFFIGNFDDQSGRFECPDHPQELLKADRALLP